MKKSSQFFYNVTCTPVYRGLDMGKSEELKSTSDALGYLETLKVIKQLSQFCQVTQPPVCPEAPVGVPQQFPDQPSLVLSGNLCLSPQLDRHCKRCGCLWGWRSGWIPVGRELAHILDSQVLLCVPGDLHSHPTNPFVHLLLLAQELWGFHQAVQDRGVVSISIVGAREVKHISVSDLLPAALIKGTKPSWIDSLGQCFNQEGLRLHRRCGLWGKLICY